MGMRTILFLFSLQCYVLGAADEKANIEKADRAMEAFQTALRQELQSAMAKGGPVAAIVVCKEKAPQIAASLSAEHGVQLRRTSLRERNPANRPDAWERATLEEFLREKAAGKPLAQISAKRQEGDRLRYMRPIGTQALCTVCHGTNVAPSLAAALKEHYPQDRATGFTEGDIRGAFSVGIPTR